MPPAAARGPARAAQVRDPVRHRRPLYATRIGSGFYIGHAGGVVVTGRTVIGRDCNLSHGVTIGQANRGPRHGWATVGDRVHIGPGVEVVGAVTIGGDVAIGASCVVTEDVPDGATVVGVPGRVISWAGSEGYVEHTEHGPPPTGSS